MSNSILSTFPSLIPSPTSEAYIQSVLSIRSPSVFKASKFPLEAPVVEQVAAPLKGKSFEPMYLEGVVKNVSLGTFFPGLGGIDLLSPQEKDSLLGESLSSPKILPFSEDIRKYYKGRTPPPVSAALCMEVSLVCGECRGGPKEAAVTPIFLLLGTFTSTLGVAAFSFAQTCKNAFLDSYITFVLR